LIGNDIIDLELFRKETNWKRDNYLKKLFTETEQQQILDSQEPELLVAIFWAMKEASYKAHQRKFSQSRTYNPSAFECEIYSDLNNSDLKGSVIILEQNYSAEISRTEEYIHCIAFSTPQQKNQKIFEKEVNIKLELRTYYSKLKKISLVDISIEKDHNFIPHLLNKGVDENENFSISHHGKLSAFVLALTNS